jgi:hypothetical protein
MIEFGGVFYYINVDALDKALEPKGYKPTDKIETTYLKTYYNEEGQVISKEETIELTTRGKEIDGPKYEVFKLMIDTLLDFIDDDEEDITLGSERALSKKPLSYQLAFNTLYNYGILKEKE